MLSLCRHFSSAVSLHGAPTVTAACRALSTTTAAAPEVVQVLKLNMLQDNPGAVKKVGGEDRIPVTPFHILSRDSFSLTFHRSLW